MDGKPTELPTIYSSYVVASASTSDNKVHFPYPFTAAMDRKLLVLVTT